MSNQNNINTKITNNKIKLPKNLFEDNTLYYFKSLNELRIYNEYELNILLKTILEHLKQNQDYLTFKRYERYIYSKMIEEEKVSKSNTVHISNNILNYYNLNTNITLIKEDKYIKILKKKI